MKVEPVIWTSEGGGGGREGGGSVKRGPVRGRLIKVGAVMGGEEGTSNGEPVKGDH